MKIKKRMCQITAYGTCDVGWGSVDQDGLKSCHDEPMEGNCRMIIEVEEEERIEANHD